MLKVTLIPHFDYKYKHLNLRMCAIMSNIGYQHRHMLAFFTITNKTIECKGFSYKLIQYINISNFFNLYCLKM